MPETFSDNTTCSRFELDVDGLIAFANYRRSEAGLAILHVEAPPVLRGTGAASRLMTQITETAKASGDKVIPYCSYARAWMSKNPT